MKKCWLVFAVTVFGFPAHTQSIISLDEFDLGGSNEPALSELEACLLKSLGNGPVGSELCETGEYQAATVITMADVQNSLEFIVPRSEQSSNSGSGSASVLPSIDMEILFEYNSSNISGDQYPRLFELAQILQNSDYNGYNFVFIGHSDAKGSDAYNVELSRERAETVAAFVASVARFSNNRVASIGFGFSRLKDPEDPLGAQNRRVQLVLVPTQ